MVVVITDGRSADDVETPSINLKRRGCSGIYFWFISFK